LTDQAPKGRELWNSDTENNVLTFEMIDFFLQLLSEVCCGG